MIKESLSVTQIKQPINQNKGLHCAKGYTCSSCYPMFTLYSLTVFGDSFTFSLFITTRNNNCFISGRNEYLFCIFFSVRLLSVLRGHSVFSSPPQRPMISDFEGFSIPDFIHYIYFPILILEKEPVFFLFECFVLNKGTTGTIFITSLV